MTRTLGMALKHTRRRIYLYGASWRVLVVSKTPAMQKHAYDEILRIMQGSSLEVENSSYGARTFIQMAGGAMLNFAVVRDTDDARLQSGRTFPHILLMYDPDYRVHGILRVLSRTHDPVDSAEVLLERVDW